MTTGKKQYVRPGHMKLDYEEDRRKKINENNRRLLAKGLKNLICPQRELSPVYGHGMNEAVRPTDEDDDFIPPDHVDEHSLGDSSEEELEMPQLRRSTRSMPERNVEEAGSNHSSNPVHNQPTVEPTASASGSATTTRSRGLARGLQPGIGDDIERPLVPIPDEWHAPVGRYGTKFAGEAGYRVRTDLPNMHYTHWSKVPLAQKQPLVASMKANFELVGTPKTVDQVIDKSLSKRGREHKYTLHTSWKKKVSKFGPEKAREKPPPSCSLQTWVDLIDNLWTTEAFKMRSAINTANRARNKSNHACGSKSLAIRGHEMMSKNNGKWSGPHHPYYKSTHFNEAKGKWSGTECQEKYNEMKALEEGREAQRELHPELLPLTQEEVSRTVLGPRSGIVKGFGMRPSSSLRSNTSSPQGTNDEVIRLEREVAEQRQQIEVQRRELEEMQSRMLQFDNIMEFLGKMGYDGPPPPPDGGSAGLGCRV